MQKFQETATQYVLDYEHFKDISLTTLFSVKFRNKNVLSLLHLCFAQIATRQASSLASWRETNQSTG